jgi:hypothetical protein
MSVVELPLLFVGDSHLRYFRFAQKIGLLFPYTVECCEVGGATAIGMRNPNSKTNAIDIFKKWLAPRDRNSIVVIHLGEVDCGFVIWYRAKKYAETVEIQLQQTVAAYFEFVDNLQKEGFHRIIVTGATQPTISDADQLTGVMKQRNSVKPSQCLRTSLTCNYNQHLQRESFERGLPFADITADALDASTGLTKINFRNKIPNDHHMDNLYAGVAWAQALNRSLLSYGNPSVSTGCWRAVTTTYLKAALLPPKDILPEFRFQAKSGEILTAELLGVFRNHLILRDIILNNERLDGRIRIARQMYWKRMV